MLALVLFSIGFVLFASHCGKGVHAASITYTHTLTSTLVRATCECGYSVNSTVSPQYAVFTDLFETDFLHLTDFTRENGWYRNNYTTQPGKNVMAKWASPSNILANPLEDEYSWAGPAVNGTDAGAQFWVRPDYGPNKDYVGTAELASYRSDIIYGSFRVAVKASAVNGTCTAFFWVRHPPFATVEI